jgi:hypothetical protein
VALNELLELDIIEVGPTLKGANPETELLTVKAEVATPRLDRAIGELASSFRPRDGSG